MPPDHIDELQHIMRQLKTGERIEAWDTVRVRKDGSRVDVSLRISPIKNRAGEVVGASKVARDITQRKRNEESLAFLAEASRSLAALADRESALQQVAHLSVPYFADWCVVYCRDAEGAVIPVAHAHRFTAKSETLSQFSARGSIQCGCTDRDRRRVSHGRATTDSPLAGRNVAEDQFRSQLAAIDARARSALATERAAANSQ